MAPVLPIEISAAETAATARVWAMWPWAAVADQAGTTALWATEAADRAVLSSMPPAVPVVQAQLVKATLVALPPRARPGVAVGVLVQLAATGPAVQAVQDRVPTASFW